MKLWWRLVAIRTCKSFVKLEFRGERRIEPSREVSLRMDGVEQLYQVNRMIRGIGNVFVLDLFSNFKWVRSSGSIGEPLVQVVTPRGPFLVSRSGDEVWT